MNSDILIAYFSDRTAIVYFWTF